MTKSLAIIFGVVFLVIIGVSFSGVTFVQDGTRGVMQTFGKVREAEVLPGPHIYNPFTTDIIIMSTRDDVMEGTITVQTEDNQQVNVNYFITYALRPDAVVDMYVNAGRQWKQKFIPQAADGSVKEVIGNQTASSIVVGQRAANIAIVERLRETLEPRGIEVQKFEFGQIDYDADWLNAVGQKQIAEQLAEKAVNDTVRIQEEATQRVIAAEAEAEAVRLRAEALEANPDIVALTAVEKWDGRMPQYILGEGSLPFIQLPRQ